MNVCNFVMFCFDGPQCCKLQLCTSLYINEYKLYFQLNQESIFYYFSSRYYFRLELNYSCSQFVNSKHNDNQSHLMTIVHSTLYVLQLVFVSVLRCFSSDNIFSIFFFDYHCFKFTINVNFISNFIVLQVFM